MLFHSSHTITSSVIYYSTDICKNEIYLLNILFVLGETVRSKVLDMAKVLHSGRTVNFHIMYSLLYFYVGAAIS